MAQGTLLNVVQQTEMGKESEKEQILTESLCCPPEIITLQLINYTQI